MTVPSGVGQIRDMDYPEFFTADGDPLGDVFLTDTWDDGHEVSFSYIQNMTSGVKKVTYLVMWYLAKHSTASRVRVSKVANPGLAAMLTSLAMEEVEGRVLAGLLDMAGDRQTIYLKARQAAISEGWVLRDTEADAELVLAQPQLAELEQDPALLQDVSELFVRHVGPLQLNQPHWERVRRPAAWLLKTYGAPQARAYLTAGENRPKLLGGGGGIEGEIFNPVDVNPGSGKNYRAIALASLPGGEIQFDSRTFIEGPDRRLHVRVSEPGPGWRPYHGHILEYVSNVFNVLPGEENRVERDVVKEELSAFSQIPNSIAGELGMPPGTPVYPSIQHAFKDHDLAFELDSDIADAKIGPLAIGEKPRMHLHYSFGFPVARMGFALREIERRTWRDRSVGSYTRDHLRMAVDIVAPEWVAKARAWSADTLRQADLDEIDGYLALLYVHMAMLAQKSSYDGLGKRNAAVLSRNHMNDIRETLSPDVRQFLHEHYYQILDNFINHFADTILPQEWLDGFERNYGERISFSGILDMAEDAVAQRGFSLRNFLRNALCEGHDITRFSADRTFGMNALEKLDTNNGKLLLPLAVVEIRSYGSREVDAGQASQNIDELSLLARRCYREALQLYGHNQGTRVPASAQAGAAPVAVAVDSGAVASGAVAEVAGRFLGWYGPVMGAAPGQDAGASAVGDLIADLAGLAGDGQLEEYLSEVFGNEDAAAALADVAGGLTRVPGRRQVGCDRPGQ